MAKYVALLIAFCALGSAQVITSQTGRKLMVFGGANHKTYLGCLSCSEFAHDAILNEFSPYGSEFSQTSIFNEFSQYGSKFSSYSACNDFAFDPPVIVDDHGGYYGELTMNEARLKRVKSGKVLAWLASVCEDH